MTNSSDYHTAIDEQLLAVALAKPDGSSALPLELEATRVKLEEIAHAAALNKQQQLNQQQHNPHGQQQQQHHHLQSDLDSAVAVHVQQQQQHHHVHPLQQLQNINVGGLNVNQNASNQQQNQRQNQQNLEVQNVNVHQNPNVIHSNVNLHHLNNSHHLHLHQQQQILQQQHLQQQLLHHYDDDPSQYSIQIPDPIIDLKLKIYPVLENTITAEGNLITRPYPEQVFQSREDLNEFIHEFARDNGFGVVIAHSNKKAIYYTCELGGRYRHKKLKKSDNPEEEALDNGYFPDPLTKTKKLRCPFSMTANFKKSTGVWTLRTTCNEHNHPQLDPLLNHPMLRKRLDELNLLILDLYKIGTKPSHIELKIKDQYPDVLIKREDIYNEIRGYKRKLKKQNRFLQSQAQSMGRGQPGPNSLQSDLYKKQRTNASLFQQVGLEDDDDDQADQVLDYELHHQHHSTHPDVELQRQLQQAAHQHQHQQQHLEHQQSQQQHQHQHLQQHQHHQIHHIDEDQLLQYQQQLQDELNHGDDSESTAAAAIAAVASATQQHQGHHHDADLSMDNIDSRLVGDVGE